MGQTFVHKGDQDLSNLTHTAFEMDLKSFKEQSKAKTLDFHPAEYKLSKWCHDTPGSVSKDQLIDLFTQDEIGKILPKLPVMPRSLSVPVGFSVLGM